MRGSRDEGLGFRVGPRSSYCEIVVSLPGPKVVAILSQQTYEKRKVPPQTLKA